MTSTCEHSARHRAGSALHWAEVCLDCHVIVATWAEPASWRTNADGSLVCPHRDLSVCPACESLPGVVEVAGAHYWDPDGSIARSL